jgi:hypothetical protein
MDRGDDLEAGRRAFASQRWQAARDRFRVADAESPLDIPDLDRLAICTYLTGQETEANALWRRAHHALVGCGEPEGAARYGFWLSLNLLLSGEVAQCAGWLARTRRLVGGRAPCAAHGYVAILEGLMTMRGGNPADAVGWFDEALALAARFDDRDLLAFALLSSGEVRIKLHQ